MTLSSHVTCKLQRTTGEEHIGVKLKLDTKIAVTVDVFCMMRCSHRSKSYMTSDTDIRFQLQEGILYRRRGRYVVSESVTPCDGWALHMDHRSVVASSFLPILLSLHSLPPKSNVMTPPKSSINHSARVPQLTATGVSHPSNLHFRVLI